MGADANFSDAFSPLTFSLFLATPATINELGSIWLLGRLEDFLFTHLATAARKSQVQRRFVINSLSLHLCC